MGDDGDVLCQPPSANIFRDVAGGEGGIPPEMRRQPPAAAPLESLREKGENSKECWGV
jgi:hypothetical protein